MNVKIILKKQVQTLLILSLIFSSLFINVNPVNAYCSASISCVETIEVGNPINIVISGSGVQWDLYLYVNDTEIKHIYDMDNVNGNVSINDSATYTPNSAGTLSVILKGTVTDAEDKHTTQISDSKTVIVKETQISQGQENQPSQGGETGGGSNPPIVPQETAPTPTQDVPPAKSNNNYLSSLSVSPGRLSPTFSRERLEYTLEFDEGFDFSTLDAVTISALPEDSGARVGGTGQVNVDAGENNIEVDVMAEDSTVRTYKISFIKPEIINQSDLRLSALTINAVDESGMMEEVELNPKFDKEIFNYDLKVSKEIEKLEIDGKVENDNIVVTIEGAENLHTGKNLVQITLVSPTDENITTVYQITVDKEDPLFAAANENVELKEQNRKKLIIGLVLGIIAILVIVLIVLLIINHRKNKKAEAGDEEDEEYDRYNKKPNDTELEEKKKKLFDYDEEDTYLTDKNLEKLNEQYKDTAKKIEKDEKEKNESFDKIAGLMESKKVDSKDEEDKLEKVEKSEEEKIEKEKEDKEEKIEKEKEEEKDKSKELLEVDYDKDDEARAKKLAELEKEIKDKRKKLTNSNSSSNTSKKKTKKAEHKKEEPKKDVKKKKNKDV